VARKPSCVLLGHDKVPDKVRLDMPMHWCPCPSYSPWYFARPIAIHAIHAAFPLLLLLPPFCYIAAGDQHARVAVRRLSLFKVRQVRENKDRVHCIVD